MSDERRITITPTDNASYRVTGKHRVFDEDGTMLQEGDEVYLCRCGGSGDKPFCDGSHRMNGFRSEVRASSSSIEPS